MAPRIVSPYAVDSVYGIRLNANSLAVFWHATTRLSGACATCAAQPHSFLLRGDGNEGLSGHVCISEMTILGVLITEASHNFQA
jgi:hypothetical protein